MKFSMEDILLINAFEKISRVSAKDCIVKGNIISFLVKGKEVGKAIGKKAMNVKELEKKLKKKIEIIGYYEKPEEVLSKTFDVKINEVKRKSKKLLLNLDLENKKKVFINIRRFKTVKELVERNYGLEMILN
ncbi:MAG: NusA-like transcription termination signal-binding factor [Candidatus ainarchaeum sp.]|nr:NusA-like transcription termination signal-binding factor [Candidatus ainarchaeum sp.]